MDSFDVLCEPQLNLVHTFQLQICANINFVVSYMCLQTSPMLGFRRYIFRHGGLFWILNLTRGLQKPVSSKLLLIFFAHVLWMVDVDQNSTTTTWFCWNVPVAPSRHQPNPNPRKTFGILFLRCEDCKEIACIAFQQHSYIFPQVTLKHFSFPNNFSVVLSICNS